MKKLVSKIFLLFISVMLFAVGINAIWEKIMYLNNKAYRNMPYGIVIANTGSSHGKYGFDYTDFEENAFNFAMSSQSVQYDEQLIDYYIDHFSKGSVLLITISYFSFWSDEMSEDSYDSKNSRYYAVLDREHMRFKMDGNDYYIKKYLPAVMALDWKLGNLFHNHNNVNNTVKTIKETGEERAQDHLEGMLLDSRDVFQTNRDSVVHMIQICKEHEVVPILITTPYLKYYSESFPEDFLMLFYNAIDEICGEQGVVYWDFSKDERFYEEQSLFMDTDHLNEEGRKMFTEIVIRKVKESLGD